GGPMLQVTLALLPMTMHPMKVIAIDWRVAAFAAMTALLGATFMTIVPARRALGRSVALQADVSFSATRRLSSGSRVGLATQVAIAMALAVGGILLGGRLVEGWQGRGRGDRRPNRVSFRHQPRATNGGRGED